MGRPSGSLGWPTKPTPPISSLIFCPAATLDPLDLGRRRGEAAAPPHRSPSCSAALFQHLHRRSPSCSFMFHGVGHLAVSCQSAPPPMAFGKTIPVPEGGDAKVGCCGYFRVSPFDFAFSMRFLVQFLLLCFPLIRSLLPHCLTTFFACLLLYFISDIPAQIHNDSSTKRAIVHGIYK
jgi:hypothetical protein